MTKPLREEGFGSMNSLSHSEQESPACSSTAQVSLKQSNQGAEAEMEVLVYGRPNRSRNRRS